MENVTVSIIPVRVISHVRTLLSNRYLLFFYFSGFGLLLSNLEISVCSSRGSCQLHLVRIDNFSLFLKVKGYFVILNACVSQFLEVMLLVIRVQLRVWISHKTVSASCHTGTLVAGGQVVKWTNICHDSIS